jgi:hypothetical protein
MRSDPALCSMHRDVELEGLDEQAVGRSFERSRQTCFGVGGALVNGLARTRTRQDLAIVVTARAQPGCCEAARPQHRDRARDLAALGQR